MGYASPEATHHCPVPLSETAVCAGVAPLPTLTVTAAVFAPVLLGRNVMLIVQLVPADSVAGNGRNLLALQVFVCAN